MDENQNREEFPQCWLHAEPAVSVYVFAAISGFHDAEDVVQRIAGELARRFEEYEDGNLVASAPCTALQASDSDTVWFGTDPRSAQRWNGRIDEVALFDRALNPEEVAALHRTAQQEIARTK